MWLKCRLAGTHSCICYEMCVLKWYFCIPHCCEWESPHGKKVTQNIDSSAASDNSDDVEPLYYHLYCVLNVQTLEGIQSIVLKLWMFEMDTPTS